jgi:hypothetical protein
VVRERWPLGVTVVEGKEPVRNAWLVIESMALLEGAGWPDMYPECYVHLAT